MTLADYLTTREIRLTDFAVSLGIKVTTLHGYVSGKRRPPVHVVAQIESATDGIVRAKDFVFEAARDAAA